MACCYSTLFMRASGFPAPFITIFIYSASQQCVLFYYYLIYKIGEVNQE